MGKPSPKRTAEFKQQAVRLHRERGGTYAEIARELGVDPLCAHAHNAWAEALRTCRVSLYW